MMKDTIYREEAIKELGREYPAMPMFKNLREEWAIKTEGFRKAEEVIMKLPSADRPQGEWIDKGDYAECSNCGADSGTQFDGVEPVSRKTKFCPNCGAHMKGVDDE